MARDREEYQPGGIFYGVLVGALRMKGTTFAQWCKARGIPHTTARAAAYGLSRSDASQNILEEMIDFAGRETVREAYRRQVAEHADAISVQKREHRRA